MKNKSKKGFTLVEIMIVVVIIGLLAALAIPAFSKVRENAIKATLANDARQISSAANQYFLERSVNSVDLDTLTDAGGDGSEAYLSGLSSDKITLDSETFTAGGTFQLSHPNYDDSPVTYSVDTGREVTASTTTTTP